MYFWHVLHVLAGVIMFVNGSVSIQDMGPESPINFNKIGTINYSGRTYLLPLLLNIEDLFSMTEPLVAGLKNCQEKYQNLTDRLTGRRGLTDNLREYFPVSMQSHIHLLLSDLAVRTTNLRTLLTTMGQYGRPYNVHEPEPNRLRFTRGLFDGIGTAAHWLTGLIDSNTYQETQDIVENLNTLSERMRAQLNIHSDILNITLLHVEEIQAHQGKAIDAINQLEANLAKFNASLDHMRDVNSALHMISAISYASSALRDLDYKFGRFADGLNTLNRGFLAPEIISPDHLGLIINSLSNKNLRPLWPATGEFINMYYRFAEVIPINTNNFFYFVTLPLLPQPNTQLDLYSVKYLPYPVSDNVTVSFGKMPPFFGISADHSLHTSLSEVDLQNCRSLNSIYFCSEVRALHRGSSPSCVYSLFTNLGIESNCEKHIGGKLQHPLIIRDESQWLYATSQTLHITIVCPSHTETKSLTIGVGSLKIGQGCRVNSDYFLIPVTETLKSKKVELVNTTLVEPFHLTLTDLETKVVDLFKNDSLYQSIMGIINDPIPISSMRGELSMLRKIQKTRIFNTKTSYYSSILGTILAIIILLFLICVCWTMHVLRRNRDRYGKKYSEDQTFLKRIQDYFLFKTTRGRTYAVQRQGGTPYIARRQQRARQSEILNAEEIVEVEMEMPDIPIQPRAEPRTIQQL